MRRLSLSTFIPSPGCVFYLIFCGRSGLARAADLHGESIRCVFCMPPWPQPTIEAPKTITRSSKSPCEGRKILSLDALPHTWDRTTPFQYFSKLAKRTCWQHTSVKHPERGARNFWHDIEEFGVGGLEMFCSLSKHHECSHFFPLHLQQYEHRLMHLKWWNQLGPMKLSLGVRSRFVRSDVHPCDNYVRPLSLEPTLV